MITADLGRAAVLLTIPLAYLLGLPRIEILYLVALSAGVLTVLFDVTYLAFVPSLVERERLVEANSRLESTSSAAQVTPSAPVRR